MAHTEASETNTLYSLIWQANPLTVRQEELVERAWEWGYRVFSGSRLSQNLVDLDERTNAVHKEVWVNTNFIACALTSSSPYSYRLDRMSQGLSLYLPTGLLFTSSNSTLLVLQCTLLSLCLVLVSCFYTTIFASAMSRVPVMKTEFQGH